VLQVACSRSGCRGRYRLNTLIAHHGAASGVRVIVPALTAPARKRSVAPMEWCDVVFPDRGSCSGSPDCAARPVEAVRKVASADPD